MHIHRQGVLLAAGLAVFAGLLLALPAPVGQARFALPGALMSPRALGAPAPAVGSVSFPTLGSFGGQVSTMAISGTLAYIGEGGALTVLDLSDAMLPRVRARLPLPRFVSSIQVAGDLVYITDSTGLRIIDVRDPSDPKLLNSYTTFSEEASSIQVSGGYAFVAVSGWSTVIGRYFTGIEILDIRDPLQPKSLATLQISRSVYALRLVSGMLYAGTGLGIEIFDVSNPVSPQRRGSYTIEPSGIVDLQVSAGRAYAVGHGGLQIVDVGNPDSPALLGRLSVADRATSVQVAGNLVYLTYRADGFGGPSGLEIIDAGNPAAPTVLSNLIASGIADHVQVVGSLVCFLLVNTSLFNGVQVLDAGNPSNPTMLGRYITPEHSTSVRVVGSYAYLTNQPGGLHIIDIADPARPLWRGSIATPGQLNDVDVVGNLAYLAHDAPPYGAGAAGLQIIDISNPISPTLRSSYSMTGEYAKSVQVVAGRAFVSARLDGIHVVDVSDPTAPKLLGSYSAPQWSAERAQVVDGLAFVAGWELRILDVSDPSQISLVGSAPTPFSGHGLVVVDKHAFVGYGGLTSAGEEGGLEIVDVSVPAAPIVLGTYPPFSFEWDIAHDLHVLGNTAYVAEGNRLRRFDVSNPADMRERGRYTAPSDIQRIQVLNGIAYIADWSGGFRIVRLGYSVYLPLVARP